MSDAVGGSVIEIDAIPNASEASEAYSFRYDSRGVFYIGFGVLAIILELSVPFARGKHGFPGPLTMIGILWILSGFFYAYVRPQFLARTWAKRGMFRWRISSELLHRSSNDGFLSGDFYWSEAKQVVETPRCFVIRWSSGLKSIIAKRGLKAGDETRLRQLIRQQVPAGNTGFLGWAKDGGW